MNEDQQSTERELKFAQVEHSLLRERLIDMAAECEGSGALEDNWIFDRNDRLADQGQALRLRADRRGNRLTFKGPAVFDGKVKIRTEYETVVDDLEQMRSILESLGYRSARRYQKIREEWRLGSIIIALDHTPIGDFAEFEGEDCERVARRCGFDPENAERRSYLRLYSDYRIEHPESPMDMIFPTEDR